MEKKVYFKAERFQKYWFEKYCNKKSSKIKFLTKTLLGGSIC